MNLPNLRFTNGKIGIWGSGIVGKSALNFFHKQGALLSVYDDKPLSPDFKSLCTHLNAQIFNPGQLHEFLTYNDAVLASAGIDLRPYASYKNKFLSEVDIFGSLYRNRLIAITGTLGKTTVTASLKTVLEGYGLRVQMGGNIGVGLFDLLDNHEAFDYAVIELSSFQLEYARTFAPDVAIWTNLYPNHLDRHGTMDDYFLAKLPIMSNQTEKQHALVHESVREYAKQSRRSLDEGRIIYFHSTIPQELAPHITHLKTYPEHYRIIYEVIRILNLDLQKLPDLLESIESPEHRVTHIACINGVDFYDDSKATIAHATQGALARCADRPVILFFGGVSKGVSRDFFFKNLPQNLKHIYLFGSEAETLKNFCPATLSHSAHTTLTEAFEACTKKMAPGDIVLFSPGGASFDLFKDYKERGQTFQKLVRDLTHISH